MTASNRSSDPATQGGTTMNTRRSGRQRERGQVLVIVAGGAIALILLMGLVLDVGVAVFNRRDGQNVSDIMSLAATRYVADVHRGEPQTDASITSTFLALQKSADAERLPGGRRGPLHLAGLVRRRGAQRARSTSAPVRSRPARPSRTTPSAFG